MVDHMGRAVVSSQLSYTHFGIMPGACTDHPEVRERAAGFMTALASRYAHAEQILMWDCWNEMRWMTQADGWVCHCERTVEAFRAYLRARHEDLDGLNEAWQRRYRSWEDVVPAKLPCRTSADAIAYAAFLAHRTEEELRWRREAVLRGDDTRPVTAHTSFPAPWASGEWTEYEPPLARGNDWNLADVVDGFGSSHFPAWMHGSPLDYGARLEAARSAAQGKPYWIAELQGGAAAHGLQWMEPVTGARQARWVWTGIARGVKGVSFWCWRDEAFGRESGGFGIAGEDGHREDRLQHLRRTADLLREHGALLDAYRPEPARVGVVFEPDALRLDWGTTLPGGLTASKSDPYQAAHAVQGCLRALEREQIPYDVLEPAHALDLSPYRLIVLPWPLIVDPALAKRLLAFEGTLLVEASLDAFDGAGLYRSPGERPFAEALGIHALGRRPADAPLSPELPSATWIEPLRADPGAEVLVRDERGALALRRGNVVALASFPSVAHWARRSPGFERFLGELAEQAGARGPLRCDAGDGERVQWRAGTSGDTRLLFAVNHSDAPLEVAFDGAGASGRDLTTGARVELSRMTLGAGAHHLVELEAR
jgi:beta-galactosidase